MRAQEGETLRQEMAERIERIEALVPTIENAAAGLVDAYRARLQKRIGELLNRNGQLVEIDPARLAQEVAYLSDRSDVSEEMVRLRSHLTQFREALNSTGEVGKMLDFLLQELQPRSQHDLVQVDRSVHQGSRPGNQGGSREDSRTGPECRVK